MTNAEWAVIVAAISVNWPNSPPPDTSLAKYRMDLDDLDPQQVAVAIESLYRQGREFCPNGAQIRQEVTRLTLDVPDWSEVWSALSAGVRSFGFARRPEVRERLQALHPFAALLLDRLDWRELCLSDTPRSVVEAQTRTKWEALCESAIRDVALHGLPSAGLDRLERVNAGPRQLGSSLRAITGGEPA